MDWNFCEELLRGDEKLSVIGLGYVGLPLAVALARKMSVIGYDRNRERIEQYKQGTDPTRELGDACLGVTSVVFTDDETTLREARFHIVAVPTPIHDNHMPDLDCLEDACRTVGRHLRPGSIVVFESTVYPGVTENVCVPLLEESSGLTCGRDFKVGYSPERINPGDRKHRLETVRKIVSGMDAATLEAVARVYETVVEAGVYRAPTIKVAEAAKVIENCQRDVNIAFINELAIMFDGMGIDVGEVLKAANTKWNFLDFTPGLVGGHCIGVDSYYLMYGAEQAGYRSRVIPACRLVNEGMGKYVAEKTVKHILKSGKELQGARVAILGFTFKENCSDIRNTGVYGIVRELRDYEIEPIVTDPLADKSAAEREFGVALQDPGAIRQMDAVIVAVAHDDYKRLSVADMDLFFGEGPKVLMDVKGILDKDPYIAAGYMYGRL